MAEATMTKELPRWDMSNVYPALDSTEFKADSEKFSAMLNEIDAYIKEHKIDETPTESDPGALAEIASGFIDLANEAYKLGITIQVYIYSFITTDSYNDDAPKAMSAHQQQMVRLQQQEDVLFKSWVGKLADKLPEIIKHEGSAKEHAFYLKEMAQFSHYLMSNKEEELAAELSLSGSVAWSRLQGTITSQLGWEVEDLDGKVEKLPMTAIINFRSHPDETMRRRGYDAENAAWKTVENQLAACLNGVKGTVNTIEKRQGREDALHSSLDMARIDRDTLNAMLSAMEDSFPMFSGYFKSKAEKLGKKSLPWWDIFAPMGNTERTFSYGEASDFVVQNFAQFSEDLADYADKVIKHNWIDVGPRDGKRAGAFCMGVPANDESRILLNFDGSLDAVSTMAHELGHGFHNECQIGKTVIQGNTPMTLAETASIMCQTIITDASLAHAASPEEELAILENDLIDSSQVVVDIYSRYLFEKEVFERRAKSELAASDFNDIMLRAQTATYGEGLDEEYRQKYMWTWKPHYYRPGLNFYNYPYTFGLLFATGLYAIYKQRGQDFVMEYKDLLASTGLGTASELAGRFGIEIREKKFWQDSLNVIGEKVERYKQL